MARVTDVRLPTNFFSDIRTKRLHRLHAAEALFGLQRLWIHAAEHFPGNGVF